jgi:hypothetical protein
VVLELKHVKTDGTDRRADLTSPLCILAMHSVQRVRDDDDDNDDDDDDDA